MQSLVNGGLGVKGQLGVDLSRDLAGDDLQDLLAELDEETVEGSLDLLVDGLALLLTVGNSSVNEGSVLGLLGSGQDQGGVGGGILGLVLADGCGTLLANLARGSILLVCHVDSIRRRHILAKSPVNRVLVESSMHASWEIGEHGHTRVADHDGASGLELLKRGRHCVDVR